jgi:hypothetical protein
VFAGNRYEPFLTFIAVTDHLEHLEEAAALQSRRARLNGPGEGGEADQDLSDIDSGVFARSQTSTGSTHGVPVGDLTCQATSGPIDKSICSGKSPSKPTLMVRLPLGIHEPIYDKGFKIWIR